MGTILELVKQKKVGSPSATYHLFKDTILSLKKPIPPRNPRHIQPCRQQIPLQNVQILPASQLGNKIQRHPFNRQIGRCAAPGRMGAHKVALRRSHSIFRSWSIDPGHTRDQFDFAVGLYVGRFGQLVVVLFQ